MVYIIRNRPILYRPMYGIVFGLALLLDGLITMLSLGFLGSNLAMKIAGILMRMRWRVSG